MYNLKNKVRLYFTLSGVENKLQSTSKELIYGFSQCAIEWVNLRLQPQKLRVPSRSTLVWTCQAFSTDSPQPALCLDGDNGCLVIFAEDQRLQWHYGVRGCAEGPATVSCGLGSSGPYPAAVSSSLKAVGRQKHKPLMGCLKCINVISFCPVL